MFAVSTDKWHKHAMKRALFVKQIKRPRIRSNFIVSKYGHSFMHSILHLIHFINTA